MASVILILSIKYINLQNYLSALIKIKNKLKTIKIETTIKLLYMALALLYKRYEDSVYLVKLKTYNLYTFT